MPTAEYYLRSRGKISGPFDLANLQKLVRRGVLSRMHEVSSDRQTWSQAADIVDLFPVRGSEVQSDEQSSTGPSAHPPIHPPGMYLYVQAGVTVGPVPLSVLQSLAQNGTLHPEDVCWQEGAEIATKASELPSLAPIFSAAGFAPLGNTVSTKASEAIRGRNEAILANAYNVCQIAGIVIGCVLLLFLNLPIRTEQTTGRTIWWWDFLRLPNAGITVVLLFFIMFAGLGCGVVGATSRGLVRAWVFIGIAILSFLLFLVPGLGEPYDNAALFFLLMLPYLAAALVGISWFRSKAPQIRIGAIFQGIFGGVLLFAATVIAILCLAEDIPSELRGFFGANPLPGWVIFAMICSLIGLVTSLIAGILGLVGLKSTFSPGVNYATDICALVSLTLPFVAGMTGVAGFVRIANADEITAGVSQGLLIFWFFRIGVMFYAFLMLLAFGLMELFFASCLADFAQSKSSR